MVGVIVAVRGAVIVAVRGAVIVAVRGAVIVAAGVLCNRVHPEATCTSLVHTVMAAVVWAVLRRWVLGSAARVLLTTSTSSASCRSVQACGKGQCIERLGCCASEAEHCTLCTYLYLCRDLQNLAAVQHLMGLRVFATCRDKISGQSTSVRQPILGWSCV